MTTATIGSRLDRIQNRLYLIRSAGVAAGGQLPTQVFSLAEDMAEPIEEAAAEALDELYWVSLALTASTANTPAPTDDDREDNDAAGDKTNTERPNAEALKMLRGLGDDQYAALMQMARAFATMGGLSDVSIEAVLSASEKSALDALDRSTARRIEAINQERAGAR